MQIYHTYSVHIFPGATIVRCSRKHLYLKYGGKIRAELLQMLDAAIFFKLFPRVNNQFFKTSFADIFRNMLFLQCNSINSRQEVHTKCWWNLWKLSLMKLIVNLHNFRLPLALPRQAFPPNESFVPHPFMQNNFQNSSPLDTSETALICILSSILNRSQANQNNSIIKG